MYDKYRYRTNYPANLGQEVAQTNKYTLRIRYIIFYMNLKGGVQLAFIINMYKCVIELH